MKKNRIILIVFSLILAFSFIQCNTNKEKDFKAETVAIKADVSAEKPTEQKKVKPFDVIDNKALTEQFIDQGEELYDAGKHATLENLAIQFVRARKKANIDIAPIKNSSGTNYTEIKKSVLVMGLLYKCDRCTDTHFTNATGFVIDESGICVTNYHVFEKLAIPETGSMILTTMDYNGNMLPIEKILCVDEKNDLAIFKVKKGDVELHPLALSDKPAGVGEDIFSIAHPNANLYQFSKGYTTRYYYSNEFKTLRMGTSVEFAVGSSGGPILNEAGQVVGVISTTIPYYGQADNGPLLQMINFETIPVSAIKSMIDKS